VNSGSAGRCAAITLATALVLVVCVLFVDRPVTDFFVAHISPPLVLDYALRAEGLLALLGIVWILGCGLVVAAGRSLSRFATTTMLASFSLTWAVVANYFVLQPFFGRIDVWHYLAHRDAYGFMFLQGHSGDGLPSGHTVVAASFLLVFWHAYPRARIPLAFAIAAVMLGLIVARWHFLADTIAGLFVGAVAATLTMRLWSRSDRVEADAGD